jgi:polysaccharide biosynthesis transport protein
MSSMPVTFQERIPMSPAPMGRSAPAAALNVNDIIRILKQRIFLILTLWIFFSGASVGLTWWLLNNRPSYEARGAVQVESPYPRTPMSMAEGPSNEQMINRYVADQIQLLKDDWVLREALLDAAVQGTQWYQQQPNKDLVLDELRDRLSVSQVPLTSYIQIRFGCKNPKDAAAVVNTIIEKYLSKLQDMSRIEYTSELEEYRSHEKQLDDSLKSILEAKQRFILEQLAAPGISEGLNVVGETLRALAAEVTKLEEEKLQAKAAYENLVGVDPTQIVLSPQMMLMIQQDPQIQNLQQNRFMLDQQKLTLLQQLGENHRSVQQLQAQMDIVDSKLRDTQTRKEKEIREYQINSAHTTFLNAVQAEMQLRERMLEAEAKQRDLDKGLAEFRTLEDKQKLLSDELNQIRNYANQLQLVVKERGSIVRVKKVGNVVPPIEPSFPKYTLMVPGGSFLGLVLGIGLALLLEFADTSVRTARDLSRHVHVPILGTVPDLDDEEVPIEKIELAMHTAPRSIVAEAFRSIRTNLLLSSPAERQRTVLVTSAKPEEGRTTIAINLAIAIGQSGRHVLLVDANFHRPALHTIFGLPQELGLSTALINGAAFETLIHPTQLPNLDVMTTGPIPPNPTELLSGTYFSQLIAQAAGRYDQIIFDGPPALLVSDALVLAGALDGVILVCRAKSASRGIVMRARDQIERVNGRIFGGVLNAARIARGGYYREQIRTYYEYQPQEVLAAQAARALPKEESPKA